MTALLELVRKLPDEDLAAAARNLSDEELAGVVRTLPAEQLVALITGGIADRDVKPPKKTRSAAKPKPAKRVPPPSKRKAAPVREGKGELRQAVLGALSDKPLTAPEIASAVGRQIGSVSGTLSLLVRDGLASRPGRGTYVRAGRQTSSRKASKPAKGSDEEEGEGVLAVEPTRVPKHFIPQLKRAVREQARAAVVQAVEDFEPDLEDLAPAPTWKPTPALKPHGENVVAELAPPVAPEAVTAPTDRIRCVPYSSTITAASCVERQACAGPRSLKGLRGTALVQTARRGDYGKCAGCPIGAIVRGRVQAPPRELRTDRRFVPRSERVA